MAPHIVPRKLYFAVFATLIAFTLVTYLVSLLELGPLNTVIAMTIAVTKMLLIMLFFMHLRYSGQLIKIFAGAGFFWLFILISLLLSDFLTRGWFPIPHGW